MVSCVSASTMINSLRRNPTLWRIPLFFLTLLLLLSSVFYFRRSLSRIGTSNGGTVSQFDRAIFGSYIDLVANNEVRRPLSNDPTPKTFIVKRGEVVDSIAQRLQEEKLIKDANLFRLFVRLNNMDKGINAGSFTLRANMNIQQIADALQRASVDEIQITIPEGKRLEEVAEIVKKQLGAEDTAYNVEEFKNLARRTNYDYPFLKNLPNGSSLEGYLFPDTYRLPQNPSSLDVLLKMLDTFESKAYPVLEKGKSQGKKPHDLLIVASIVEREAVVASERPMIASVYLNRLKIGMKLDADPTTQYGMGYDAEQKTWWRILTLEDYKFQDPGNYNTYINPSLPPGPISNPGLGSIEAVVEPAENNFIFFRACPGEQNHLFFETYAQQLEACQ